MTACTPKTLQCHYSITCRMLYVDKSEAFAPLIIFILVVWNFSICLIEPIRFLGCTSVPVPMYQCITISTMHQRNVPGIWPTRSTRSTRSTRLPGPGPYQALPGPTRTYQDLPDPTRPYLASASQKTTRWITYFFGSPQKHLQNDMLFYGASWKSKNAILQCKMYVFAMFWRSKMQKTYILHCKIAVFQILEKKSRFQTPIWSPKVKNIYFTL